MLCPPGRGHSTESGVSLLVAKPDLTTLQFVLLGHWHGISKSQPLPLEGRAELHAGEDYHGDQTPNKLGGKHGGLVVAGGCGESRMGGDPFTGMQSPLGVMRWN